MKAPMLAALLAMVGAHAAGAQSFGGQRYRLAERAHDGTRDVPAATLTPVDADAMLLVTFTRDTMAPAPPSPEWLRVNTLLTTVQELTRQRADLNAAAVNRHDSAAVAAFQNQVRAYDSAVGALAAKLFGLLSTDDARRVLTGAFEGGTGDATRSLENLARWLQLQLTSLRDGAATTSRRDSMRVHVAAVLEPANGDASALHVVNYDSLPAGAFRPVDRLGFKLTPEAQRQLAMSLEMNRGAAQALRQISSQRTQIDTLLRGFVTTIGADLERFRRGLDSTLVLALAVDSAASAIRGVTGAEALATEIRGVRSDVNSLRGLATQVGALARRLQDPGAILREYLGSGSLSIVATFDSLVGRLPAVERTLTGLPARLARVDTLARNLAGSAGAEVRRIMSGRLQDLTRALADSLPAVAAAGELAQDMFSAPVRGGARAADVLAGMEHGEILHGLDAPQAQVELSRIGWQRGDRVFVRIRFYELDGSGGRPVVHEEMYEVSAEVFGARRDVSSSLIFARAVSGTGPREWQPNVAAMNTWHYRYRPSPNGLRRFWNGLDPGFGLHLASLDQGDDTMEFGMGLSLTIWSGLLSTGFGYNLSQESTYALLGIDLFDVLNRTIAPR